MLHLTRALFFVALLLLPASLHAEPSNIAALKTELRTYVGSGAYENDIAKAVSKAKAYISHRAGKAEKPAIILDIDETALSNWPALTSNDFASLPDAPCADLAKGPCGMKAWQARTEASAIAPTLALYQLAREQNITVFFITGRDETLRAATEANLKKVGYNDYAALIMRPAGSTTRSAADYKAPERAKIEEQGFTILATVGDQQSDLTGGHAERTFLLPNPFYLIP